MKTRTIITFYLILFLIGMALAGVSQGIVNDGGYIEGNASSYTKISGSGDALLVNASADQVTFGNLEVDFTGAGTYKLTITDSSFITVDGALNISDTLILECNSGEMANLITNGTISGAYAKVEQHLQADHWNMVSSPMTSATASVYEGSYLLDWNETDSTWSYIISLTDPLNTNEGYFVWPESTISSPVNVAYTGLLNTGNQSVSGLTYTAGAGKGNGWNLVGNPYPSVLEWNSSWTTSGVDATIYIYDGSNYKTWNYNLGGFGSMGNGYIPPTQGFWVKANSTGPSVTIPNSARTHAAQTFYKGSENTVWNMFSVKISDNTHSDELIIGFQEGGKDGFSGTFDAYKLFGIESIPQVYALAGEEQFAVDIMEPLNGKIKSVKLGFRAGTGGIYNLVFENLDMIDPAYDIYLEDKLSFGTSKKLVDIKSHPEYKFSATAGTEEDRFVLHFYPINENNNNETGFNNDGGGFSNIYAWEKVVFVNYQQDEPAEIVIYNMMGKEIMKKQISQLALHKMTLHADKGYYIVKVLTANNIQTEKVFIN
ncbi:MAG: T9SS type A sorting domain-containing protein [Bacteroidales bacterium]|nr:T9SS type A sorting domain-containing protein [Bacteroidales bacterium]